MKAEFSNLGPLPLWPTPLYLKLIGKPAWRFKAEIPITLDFYSGTVHYKIAWIYVDKSK